ncbi:MAG: hypothetical protein OXG88_07825 [Gammaproteobacteria bacterium]|nr:hypothetical protein [Gammaproteobacteria bacterium]
MALNLAAQLNMELGVATKLLFRRSRELKTHQEAVKRPAYDDLERENRGLWREV